LEAKIWRALKKSNVEVEEVEQIGKGEL